MLLPLTPGVLRDLTLSLRVLDDTEVTWPVDADITIGRQLDNDLVVAGEDVADFHARIELGQRSIQLVLLGTATASVNGVMVEGRTGLMPGDEILLGTHLLVLDATGNAERSCQWALHPAVGRDSVDVGTHLSIGRGSDCTLRLNDRHVSRHHATVSVTGGSVWLRDQHSANGTYVNGDRVVGACRLFHGDVVSFDALSYQIIGDDPDLTPVMPFDPSLIRPTPDRLVDTTLTSGQTAGASDLSLSRDGTERETAHTPVTPSPAESAPRSTVEMTPDDLDAMQVAASAPISDGALVAERRSDKPVANAPALVGLSGDLAGQLVPLRFGRYLIGRDPDAGIRLDDEAVSLRHAELDVRADGIFITNLMATNGTMVNARVIHTARLTPGDHLRIGRSLFVLRGAGESGLSLLDELRSKRSVIMAVAGVSGLAVVLTALWWLAR